jgi:hypothetical protein
MIKRCTSHSARSQIWKSHSESLVQRNLQIRGLQNCPFGSCHVLTACRYTASAARAVAFAVYCFSGKGIEPFMALIALTPSGWGRGYRYVSWVKYSIADAVWKLKVASHPAECVLKKSVYSSVPNGYKEILSHIRGCEGASRSFRTGRLEREL